MSCVSVKLDGGSARVSMGSALEGSRGREFWGGPPRNRGWNFGGDSRTLHFCSNVRADFTSILMFSGNSDGSGGLGKVF